MIALVLTTEAERTEQKVMLLVVLLFAVALLLAAATIWYWRHTNPRRRYRSEAELDLRHRRLDGGMPGYGGEPGRMDPAPTGQYPTSQGRRGGYQADPYGTRYPQGGQYGSGPSPQHGGQNGNGYGPGQQVGGYGAGQQAGGYGGGYTPPAGNGRHGGGYGQQPHYGGQGSQPSERERILPRSSEAPARRPPDGGNPNWR